MADNSFDVLIRFITEMVGGDATKAVVKDLGSLEKQIEDSNTAIEKANDILDEWKLKLKDLKTELEGVRKGGAAYKQIKSEMAELNGLIDEGTAIIKDNKEAHRQLVKQLEDEKKAQDLVLKSMRDQENVLNKKAQRARDVAGKLDQFGTGAVVAGTAIGGGIIAEATRYAAKMGDATKGTAAFNAELKKIEEARGRIDEVLVAQVLPILEVASKVASKVADIIEANPELISLALKGAALLVSIGTLAKIAAGGIRMYADVTFAAAQALGLKAAETQLLASTNQLTAAGIKTGVSGASSATAGALGKIGGVIGTIALTATAVYLTGTLVNAGLDAVKQPHLEDMGKAEFDFIKRLPEVLSGKIKLNDLAAEVVNFAIKSGDARRAANEMNDGIGKAASGMSDFGDKTQDMIAAFSKMQTDIASSNIKYESDRLKIVQDANNAVNKVNADSFAKMKSINENMRKINEKASADRGSIISNFVKQSAETQRKYESERANIIRDGGIEIQRIEKNRLEELQKLEMDHNDRVGELAANRDALGLVLEQRAFDRAKAEIDNKTNDEIAQRRQDMAIRLQDLAANFAAERAQKQAQFQQDLLDNQNKRLADLKEQAALRAEEAKRRSDEVKQIRADENTKLQDLARAHLAEITQIRAAFVARRQDLGVFLNNEREQIRQNQAAILADLKAQLARETRPPGRAAGGYTYGEVIQTHGVEFVTNPATTRALERMVGGRLNQQNLIAAVAGGGPNITLNDSRRFSGEYTKSMRREVRQTTLEALNEVFKK
jgi:chromosome segregation ATPase